MDFEKATDFELETRLTILITGEHPVDKAPSERLRCYIANDFDNQYFPPEEARKYVDVPRYCTDISATWPLMIEHGVSVNALSGGDYKAFEIYEKSGVHGNDIADENGLLRAVVVCLIKVLESKHERT
ncbi:TPA: hypothetical protein I6Z04_000152 [Vibrio cholerae]|nr:hypothetical protein [Vibrio cholerae]